ncbi:MAG: YfhO family protein [Prevotellaceae bacterium]|jgi:hypothetical protein|nr:YfhO family protein [Prevotellaceae bacterium]
MLIISQLKNKDFLRKKVLPHVIAVIALLTMALVYFNPTLKGKELQQGDVTKWLGMSQEIRTFYEKTGETSLWTGSMFSGMPTYHIGVYGLKSINYNNHFLDIFGIFDMSSLAPILCCLIAAYIMLILLGMNVWIGVLGAIAFTFTSYNFIILHAGHVTKIWAISLVPLVMAGVILAYRGKYFWGSLLTAIALSIQISRNHYQITYYLAIIVFVLILGHLVEAVRNKTYKNFITASVGLLIAAVLSVGCNAQDMYSNLELGRESIRGKSELTSIDPVQAEAQGSGLDKDYAFAWSYGVGETLSLLIPDIHGGASNGKVGQSSELYKACKSRGVRLGKDIQTYTYWGDQPFTSGPVYFGAIMCFLFVLGLLVTRGPVRWWLLGLTALSVFLSWGKNMEWFNDFFFYHIPFYNKFRTPSMALVIAQFTVPLLALLGLNEVVRKRMSTAELLKGLKYSLIIAGGVCLILAIMPGVFFDFTSVHDAQYGLPDWYYNALLRDRESLLRSDALRSLMFILAAGVILWLHVKGTLKKVSYVLAACTVLVLIDLWTVDKRYLNDESFVYQKNNKAVFAKTKADEFILADTALSVRVLTLNNPFNDSFVSYYHKSIGGYNAAKLRRYQDLIERRLTGEMSYFAKNISEARSMEDVNKILDNTTTLNMLNAKYIIHDKNAEPFVNNHTYGNAWFVDEIRMVENADEEMAMLASIVPNRTALVDKRYEELVNNFVPGKGGDADNIYMTSYAPNKVKYEASAENDRLAVFSEVYYKDGWNVFIDGQPAPHFRTNWILRGMIVPAGKHSIEFVFKPSEFYTFISISRAVSGLIILALAGGIFFSLVKRKKEAA